MRAMSALDLGGEVHNIANIWWCFGGASPEVAKGCFLVIGQVCFEL